MDSTDRRVVPWPLARARASARRRIPRRVARLAASISVAGVASVVSVTTMVTACSGSDQGLEFSSALSGDADAADASPGDPGEDADAALGAEAPGATDARTTDAAPSPPHPGRGTRGGATDGGDGGAQDGDAGVDASTDGSAFDPADATAPDARSGASCPVTFTVRGANLDLVMYSGVFVGGAGTSLGEWRTASAIAMNLAGPDTWSTMLNANDGDLLQFKFLKRGVATAWETWSPDVPRSIRVVCDQPGTVAASSWVAGSDAGIATGTGYAGVFGTRPSDAR